MDRSNMKMARYLLFLLFFIPLSSEGQNEGYQIKVEVKGLKADTVYLANYLGPKLYYYDTTASEKASQYVFAGDEPIKAGMYAFVANGRKLFDLLVEEQRFSLVTKKKQPVRNLKVNNSPNNQAFYNYIRHIRKQKSKAQPWRKKMKKAKGKEKEKLKVKLDALDQKVRRYQKKMAEKHQDLLAGKIFKASISVSDPKAPDSLSKKETRRYEHQYYKEHFLDNVALKDERLARTPIIGNKIKTYFGRFVTEQPDSAIKAAERVLSRVKEGTDMYKYVVPFITNKYLDSDIMGMDAVFVHMAENYYFDGKSFWMSEKNLKDWKERVEKVKPLLVGKKAPIITLTDTNGNFIPLSKMDAQYTVLYFWDPECGHCKKATPKLKKAYDTLKSKGVKVYAVGTPLKNQKWKKYIRKHDLSWTNVSDNPDINNNPREYLDRTDLKSMNFRKTYDIYSTPRIFLLDEDKKIIAKKLGIDQVVKYINRLLNDKEIKGKQSVSEHAKKGKQ